MSKDDYDRGRDFGKDEAEGNVPFLETFGSDIAAPFNPDYAQGREDGYKEGLEDN